MYVYLYIAETSWLPGSESPSKQNIKLAVVESVQSNNSSVRSATVRYTVINNNRPDEFLSVYLIGQKKYALEFRIFQYVCVLSH